MAEDWEEWEAEEKESLENIERLVGEGHTHHCACRMTWGDGECECNKQGITPGEISKMIEDIGAIPAMPMK